MKNNKNVEIRYQHVCEILGIPPENRPRLKLEASVQQLSRRLAGMYMPHSHTIILPVDAPTHDWIIAHELCHSVCGRTMGYRGHHGAPFLALWHLVCLYYLPGYDGKMIESTVCTEWPRLVPKRWRQREIDAAIEASTLIQSDVDNTKLPPTIEALAIRVRHHFADRVDDNVSVLDTWKDRALTQRGQWMSYLLAVALTVTILCIGFAQLLNAGKMRMYLIWIPVAALLSGITGLGLVIWTQEMLIKARGLKTVLGRIFRRA